MKKVLLSCIFASVVTGSLFASGASEEVKAGVGEVEKKGFLATEECIKKGEFKDCRLDTTLTSPLALYVHSEGTMYRLDPGSVHLRELDEGIGKNNVTIIGVLEKDNVIKMRGYKAPPPEAKSFFKGCL